jgi:hypothetical protein
MARVIVMPNHAQDVDIDGHVLMDERVDPVHLEDEHSSHQVIERLAWAVLDAEEIVPVTWRVRRPVGPRSSSHRSPPRLRIESQRHLKVPVG